MKTLVESLLIALLLICSSSAPAFGQDGAEPVIPPEFPEHDLRYQHLTTKDGLSEGRVWGILQDRQGFMWFTTWDGVNRFDGYEFKVYKEELGNPNSPGGEGFWTVHEDQEGMIWAGSHTGGGLSRFDPTTEQWRRYQHDPDDPHSLSSNNVFDILEDHMGVLWVSTEGGGINRFEGETEAGLARFTRYPTAPGDPSGTSSDFAPTIYEDRSGELWFCTWGGLNRYDRETETFIHYQHDPDDPTSLSHGHVYTTYEDSSGVLWVGTYGGGLNRLDRETETFTHYRHDPDDPHSVSDDNITSIFEDGSGTLWIGSFGGGLNRYDRETDTFVSYQHDSKNTRSLGNNTVTALFQDQSGILWIGTAGGGIDRLDPFGQKFEMVQHNPADSSSLSNNDVRHVFEDRAGDLWMATWGGGLNRYDPETKTFTHYLNDPDDPGSLGDSHVYFVLEDREGGLWIGLDSGGLSRLDRGTEDGPSTHFTRFKHDPADPQSLSGDSVTTLYEDRAGILWVGTWTGGLNALDRLTEDGHARFKRYQYDPEDTGSLPQGIVWSIHEDPTGTLWIGMGGGGLCRFDRETETFACYSNDPEDEHSLSSNTVWAIHQDQDGTFWLGTSAGLNRFSPQTGQFAYYTTADGLPHDTVVAILEDAPSSGDGRGHLWLSTLGGLSRFDPQLGTFHNYDASDGLPGNIFNVAALRTSSGMMLFGGQQGLTSFYPEDLRENPNIPPVHVIDFALANEPVLIGGDSPLQQSIVETEHLELSYEERVISFEFAALAYASPEKNRYRYKLEGFDEEWIEVGSDRRFVTYTNLDPGQYTFRVLGSNNDGVWNEEGTSINLTITPPWWGTWWFRGGLLLLLVGLVASGFVLQRQNARRRERQLEAAVVERARALGSAEEQIRTLFATSQVGIGLTTVEGKMLAANEALLRMTGYSESEMLERRVTEFYFHPEQRDELLELLSESETVANFGIVMKHKEGTPFSASLNVSKVHREGQEVILTMIEDVTEQVQLNEQLQQEFAERKKAQQELQTQISLIDGLLDAATETVEIFDANTMEYIKWNEALSQVTGYADEEIAAMNPVSDFIEEGDLPRAEAAIGELLRTGHATERLLQVNKDGSQAPFEYTGAITRDVEGNPLHGIIIGRDIAERLEAEEQLRFQAELLEAVEQAVVVTDLGGHVVYWNPFAERLYGWSAEEAMGRVSNELMMNNGVNQQLDTELTALLLSGKGWSGEYPAFHRDGTPLFVQATITPITNEAGDPIFAIGISTDISERKRAEVALRESEKAYRNLVETISDVIYTIDTEGVITYLNPAVEALIGLPPEQVVGQSFSQFVHPKDLGRMRENVQNLLSGMDPGTTEYRVLSNSGETRWIRVTSQPIGDEGQVTSVQGVLTDITERKKVEAQLEDAATAAERQRLARELHDSVTQTLYSLDLFANAAQEALAKGRIETGRGHAARIRGLSQSALADMRLLIFELRPPLLEQEGLAGALRARLEMVEARAGLQTEFEAVAERPLSPAIETELYAVARESLNNALKHAQADQITVKLEYDEQRCCLTVQDDGVGFDLADTERGGGLGLRNMRARVERVGGNLTLETALGKGTTVRVEVTA